MIVYDFWKTPHVVGMQYSISIDCIDKKEFVNHVHPRPCLFLEMARRIIENQNAPHSSYSITDESFVRCATVLYVGYIPSTLLYHSSQHN